MTAVDIDLRIVAAVAIGATVVLWAVAIVLGRVDSRVTARGFRNGALIAIVLFAITAVVVAFVFNGRAVFVTTLDLAGAIGLGLLMGLIVALGYLWLGSLLIAIGLIFRSKPQWTTLGAWAAVPVIIVAAGFGYVSYRSASADSASSSTANGQLSITLSGPGTGRVSADGAATCSTGSDGTVTVQAGTAADPHIITTDGRLTNVRIVMNPEVGGASLEAFAVAGLDVVPGSVTTATGSTATSGQLQLQATSWSGAISWSCNR